MLHRCLESIVNRLSSGVLRDPIGDATFAREGGLLPEADAEHIPDLLEAPAGGLKSSVEGSDLGRHQYFGRALMNSLLASPVVQLLARVSAVAIVVMTQWWSGNPDRFIAHVEGRVERQGQSLREAVRQTLAMRMMQLGAPMLFFLSPELYGSLVQGVAILVGLLTMVAAGMLSYSSWPPTFLKRRWMDDFDQWWNYPGMAIRAHRSRGDTEH